MKTTLLACLLIVVSITTVAQDVDRSAKPCVVTEVVTEGVRSDCGSWRPAKGEKIFMPTEVSKSLQVGDAFYFAWNGSRWVAQKPTENTVALVFPDRVEIVSEAKAQTEFQQLQNKAIMTKDDQSRFIALTIALGTASRPQALPRNTSTREFLDNEVRRGVRRPAQGDNYFPE